jgi:dTDP-4-dehydrorhamnose 3,5-epimerase
VPERFAHGFVTLTDTTELMYLISNYYTPGAEGGLRYDDPVLGLVWPVPIQVTSERDTRWKAYSEIQTELKTRMSMTSPTGA